MTRPNNIGISISIDEDSQILLTEGILAILAEPRDEQTIQKALEVLEKGTQTSTAITGNTIMMGEE